MILSQGYDHCPKGYMLGYSMSFSWVFHEFLNNYENIVNKYQFELVFVVGLASYKFASTFNFSKPNALLCLKMGIYSVWVWGPFHTDFPSVSTFLTWFLKTLKNFQHFQLLLLSRIFIDFKLRKMAEFQIESFVNMDENSELTVLQDLNLNSTR